MQVAALRAVCLQEQINAPAQVTVSISAKNAAYAKIAAFVYAVLFAMNFLVHAVHIQEYAVEHPATNVSTVSVSAMTAENVRTAATAVPIRDATLPPAFAPKIIVKDAACIVYVKAP